MPNLNWAEPKDHTELFSGCASVTRGEMQEGRSVFAYDIVYNSEFMDIMTPQGFALAIYAVLNTKRAGGLTLAPVCSTWVFMSRGSTLRSRARPLGSGKGSCHIGSVMAARCAILLLLAARGLFWILEHPKGSLFQYHPLIQHVLGLIKFSRKHIRMGDYGGHSQKPTWLYSGHGEILDELDKFKPLRTPVREKHELVEKYVDGKGKSRIKGSSNLKSSQTYPLQFGRALARLRTRRMKDIKKTSKAFVKQSPQSVAKKRTGSLSVWIDMANLQPVFDYLS
ncbi:Uncharacterized protein SCF082_LOCUS35732 [Durusdinium trenchii]|uniref:Uncharacterized protein n=1 Tax=Durusdinium trenchii TaxID=1381693 RepID=A0ABP0P9M3_9DINO